MPAFGTPMPTPSGADEGREDLTPTEDNGRNPQRSDCVNNVAAQGEETTPTGLSCFEEPGNAAKDTRALSATTYTASEVPRVLNHEADNQPVEGRTSQIKPEAQDDGALLLGEGENNARLPTGSHSSGEGHSDLTQSTRRSADSDNLKTRRRCTSSFITRRSDGCETKPAPPQLRVTSPGGWESVLRDAGNRQTMRDLYCRVRSARGMARANLYYNSFEHGMAAALPLYAKWTAERLRQLHLGACHVSSLSIAASLGFDRSFAKLVDDANRNCYGCTVGKGRVKLPQPTKPDHQSTAAHFNDRISMDYIVTFGCWNVLVFLDDCSRFAAVVCLRHRDKESTLTAFRERWEAKYYLPRRFRHDNDGGFVDLDAFLTGAGVFREEIPPHTPELDGQNERSHGTLMDMYRTVMAHSNLPQTDAIRRLVIENHIPEVYNNLVHSATGQAPVQRAWGRSPSLDCVALYYPGRPVVFKPKQEALWIQKGRKNWQPGRAIAQLNSDMVAVLDDNGRIWRLPLGRIQLKDAYSAQARAELDRAPVDTKKDIRSTASTAPWNITGPPIDVDEDDSEVDSMPDLDVSDDDDEDDMPALYEEDSDEDDTYFDDLTDADIADLPGPGPSSSGPAIGRSCRPSARSREMRQQRAPSASPSATPSTSTAATIPRAAHSPRAARSGASQQQVSTSPDYYDQADEYYGRSPSTARSSIPSVAPRGNPDDPHDHRPPPTPSPETSTSTLAYGLGAELSVKDLTKEERKFADTAEINGWKDKGVYTEVTMHSCTSYVQEGRRSDNFLPVRLHPKATHS